MTFILFHASDSFFPYAFCLRSFQPSPCGVCAAWQVHYIGTCLRCALIRGVRLPPPPVTKWRSLDCAASSFLRASVSYFYSISHRPPETHQTAPLSLSPLVFCVCLSPCLRFVCQSQLCSISRNFPPAVRPRKVMRARSCYFLAIFAAARIDR